MAQLTEKPQVGLGAAVNELAAIEAGPGADERDKVGCADGAPAFLAASIRVNAMAIAALEPGPLVT